MKAGIIQALENAGVFVDVEEQNEINIINLIDDSIQFVSFVVQLEEIFKIELTSELLVIDNFSTIDSVCEILQALCEYKALYTLSYSMVLKQKDGGIADMKTLKKIAIKKTIVKSDKNKVMLYSTEGNGCSNAPYGSNCSC